MNVDVVAIGAHPDDVELTVGGTLAKLAARGRRVAIVDLTRGEMGSNGTPEQRLQEAEEAARVLGAERRINLDLGDGRLANTLEQRVAVVEVLRELRPTLVLANYWHDLHPDHTAAGQIVRDIMYPIGFVRFPAAGAAYRPHEFLFYMSHFPFEPSFVIDISDHHARKMEAVRCYASQLHVEGQERTRTPIAQPDFLQQLEARARYFGSLIHRSHGEPLLAPRPVPMDDPVDHYRPFARP